MLRKYLIKRKLGPKSVRWRQHAPTRMEGFTDSVFAFAVTLIVVSLQVPETYTELLQSMRGLLGFAICFTLMMFIWFEQYMYFRKYGLQDVRTIFLNSMLLFVVLFYVYPLKFLFTFLTQGNEIIHPGGGILHRFSESSELNELMMIYSGGFIIIYTLFFLMHRHALKKKTELMLNELEIFNTHTAIKGNLSMIAIGLLSLILALFGYMGAAVMSFFSGISYALIGPVLSILYSYRIRKMKQLFSQDDIDKIMSEEIIMEIRKTV